MVNSVWVGSPNYTAGRQQAIQYITMHIMVGTLSGTDRTFQIQGGASSTFGVGGNGDIHQYVNEADTPWSDGNGSYGNSAAISIEHEGGLNGIPNTDSCVEASAQLCADIARRQGWSKLVHGENFRLHREIPPYTHPNCPDNCPNPLRWQEILNRANEILGNEVDMPAKTDPIAWDNAGNVTVEYALQDLKHMLETVIGKFGGFDSAANAVWFGIGGGDVKETPLYQLRDAQNHSVGAYDIANKIYETLNNISKTSGISVDDLRKAVAEGVKDGIENIHTTVEVKK
jgi:hypothetical protein